MANEKRLIDANALMKAIKSFRWFGVPNTLQLMFDYLKIIIKEQPTVDAVEVVHGRWMHGYPIFCSVCNGAAPTDYEDANRYEALITPYCPNCGAKMDGDGNG